VKGREWDVTGRDVPRGRLRISYRAAKPRDRQRRKVSLDQLRAWSAWDVLHGVADGALDVGAVAEAVKLRGEPALVELRALLDTARAGQVPTVEQEAARYLEWYGRQKQAHSAKQVRSRLTMLCKEIGGVPLTSLTRDGIERALARWKADATREAVRVALSGLYSWSIAREAEAARIEGRAPRWGVNPASFKTERGLPRVVTATERQVLALLENAEIHQAAYVRAFVHMGFRKDELIHTRMHHDLDTDTWLWRVQARAPEPDACGCIQCRERGWSPKTRGSVRTLLVPPAPPQLRAAVTEYLDAYPVEPGGFVFRNPRTGGVWDAGALSRDFEALCDRAEVTYGRGKAGGIVLHDLRATCATRLVRAGERESVIAVLLGDTVETITNSYVRLVPADLANAVMRGPAYTETEGK
jgi:integrase